MTQMPKRIPGRINNNRIIRKEYTYADVVNYSIKPENIEYIIIGKNDINYNMDYLRKIINCDKEIKIKFMDWDSACYIDSNINTIIENDCFLVSDGLRISREYIDLSKLHNIRLTVPLNYLVWGIKFNNLVDTYCFQFENKIAEYLGFGSLNGNTKFTRDNLEKIVKTIKELNSNGMLSDVEKTLLVSDYIQSHTQFIDAIESESTRGTFITPNFPIYDIYREKSGLVETVLNDNNGLCMGIANLSTLFLNNPEFDLEVESIYGSGHVWNRVLIDGKYYYFDNTWNITRSDSPCENGLITLSFCSKYNFFGNTTALNIGHHIQESTPFYNNGVLSEDDYQKVQYMSRFEYPSEPFYKSYKK